MKLFQNSQLIFPPRNNGNRVVANHCDASQIMWAAAARKAIRCLAIVLLTVHQAVLIGATDAQTFWDANVVASEFGNPAAWTAGVPDAVTDTTFDSVSPSVIFSQDGEAESLLIENSSTTFWNLTAGETVRSISVGGTTTIRGTGGMTSELSLRTGIAPPNISRMHLNTNELDIVDGTLNLAQGAAVTTTGGSFLSKSASDQGSSIFVGANSQLNTNLVLVDGGSLISAFDGGVIAANSVQLFGDGEAAFGFVSGPTSQLTSETNIGVGFEATTGTLSLVNGGQVAATNSVFVSDGSSLFGNGSITAAEFTNRGRVAPDGANGALFQVTPTPIGPVTIDANYIQTGTGSLEVDLASVNTESIVGNPFDQLDISGDATIAGTLSVNFPVIIAVFPEISLRAGDTFEILDVDGTLSGQFDGLGEGALIDNFDGVELFITYAGGDGNDVVLFTSLEGDFDLDGDVDDVDINQYSGNIGVDVLDETYDHRLDFDLDGNIDLVDHETLVTEFVQTSNSQTGTFIGDVNLDGRVDVLGDAFALVGNLGSDIAVWSDGDLNADGRVDVLGDAFRLVGNLGMSNGPPANAPMTSSVPEPGSVSLLAIVGLASVFRRRKR